MDLPSTARGLIRPALWLAAGLAATVLNLWLDVVTPNQYSFEIFYLVPILAVTLGAGRNAGIVLGVAAAAAWSVDTLNEDGYPLTSITWDLVTRTVSFVGVAILVDLYRRRGVRLTDLDRHREDSFALVAHKLRQTARRITSVTGAIASRDVDGIVTEARLALEHQARELQQMAEDVLDASVLEAKRFRLNLSDVDLTDLVTNVASEIGRGQVQLVLQAEPVVVEGDADRLRLMISHLIGNAVNYSPAGAPILVTVSSGHGDARIVVKDQGVGFGRSDLTVLFQKYGQAQTAKKAGAQGVGLGLYVTRLLAEAHGGTVTAESTGPGLGSTFQLSLPVHQPKGSAA
jgi:signal transduction histidine kinase